MSEPQPAMAAEPLPPIKTVWLTFHSAPWKNCFRIIGTLEINGIDGPKRKVFDCVVPELDGLVCESHNLTYLFKPESQAEDRSE